MIANDNGIGELNTDLNPRNSGLTVNPDWRNVFNTPVMSLAAIESKNIIFTTVHDHARSISDDCGITWQLHGGWEADKFFSAPANDAAYLVTDPTMISPSFTLKFLDIPQEIISRLPKPVYNLEGKASSKNLIAVQEGFPYRSYVIYRDGDKYRLFSFLLTNDASKLDTKEYETPFSVAFKILVDPRDERHLFVLDGYPPRIIYESKDGGAGWVKYFDIPQGVFADVSSLNPFDSKEIMLGGAGKLFSVVNGAMKEITSLPSVAGSNDINTIVYDSQRRDVVYVGTTKGFFNSTNNGDSWIKFVKGLQAEDVNQIIPLTDKILIGTLGSGNAVILKEKLLASRMQPIITRSEISKTTGKEVTASGPSRATKTPITQSMIDALRKRVEELRKQRDALREQIDAVKRARQQPGTVTIPSKPLLPAAPVSRQLGDITEALQSILESMQGAVR
ncbi:MAG: hypothetical protein HYY10_00705 [Candidatus Liptonbacteria bacterium]|nr:hypothetical protein [Candidatus Liptonbacteria bacterium]